eukprot:349694-Chlamydomonas_euryale.AAC.5
MAAAWHKHPGLKMMSHLTLAAWPTATQTDAQARPLQPPLPSIRTFPHRHPSATCSVPSPSARDLVIVVRERFTVGRVSGRWPHKHARRRVCRLGVDVEQRLLLGAA